MKDDMNNGKFTFQAVVKFEMDGEEAAQEMGEKDGVDGPPRPDRLIPVIVLEVSDN